MVQIITSSSPSDLDGRPDNKLDLFDWDLSVAERFVEDRASAPGTIHLVDRAADGRLLGFATLVRSDERHGPFHDVALPAGPGVARIAGLYHGPGQFAADRLRNRNRLISALVDLAILTGLNMLTGRISVKFAPQLATMGWRCRTLTDDRPERAGPLVGYTIDIEPQTRRRLDATGIYTPACLRVLDEPLVVPDQ